MMMIAFIDLKRSSLIILIEALCSLDSSSWFYDHIFGFFSLEKKYVDEKKQSVQDLIPPPSIYIHMCNLYTYTSTYMPKFSPYGIFGPIRCFVQTPELTSSTPHAEYACVCVYTHVHPHTLSPVYREDTRQYPYLSESPSVKNKLPRQVTSALHSLAVD